jgi:hypothetical protein
MMPASVPPAQAAKEMLIEPACGSVPRLSTISLSPSFVTLT